MYAYTPRMHTTLLVPLVVCAYAQSDIESDEYSSSVAFDIAMALMTSVASGDHRT